MATWIMHLRIAEKVKHIFDCLDETAYYVGAVAPDGGQMINNFTYVPPKDVSHWKREDVSYEQRFKDNAEFFYKYIQNETDLHTRSLCLGYYVHILTDTMYVRDIIHPFIQKNGKPFWRANIEQIRAGWYEIDFRFLAKNPHYRPLEVISGVHEFKNTYFDYFAEDDIIERVRFAVDVYTNASVNENAVFLTHDEQKADEMIEYMAEDIIKILKETHNI